MNSISHPSIGWNFAENQHLCKSVLLGHGSCHQGLVAFPVTSIFQTHCLLCVRAAAATPCPRWSSHPRAHPLPATPHSFPDHQHVHPARLSLCWKPVCGSPLPAGSPPTSLSSHSSAFHGLPRATLFPMRLTLTSPRLSTILCSSTQSLQAPHRLRSPPPPPWSACRHFCARRLLLAILGGSWA